MLKIDTIRPYQEGDIDLIVVREPDLTFAGKDYKDTIKKNISVSETVTVQANEEILAIAGLAMISARVGEAWSITGEPVQRHKIVFAQASIVLFNYWINKHNLQRVQAVVQEDYAKSIKWLEWLGFEQEGLMKKFGVSGENFYRYARIN